MNSRRPPRATHDALITTRAKLGRGLLVWGFVTAASLGVGCWLGRPTRPFREFHIYTFFTFGTLATAAWEARKRGRSGSLSLRSFWRFFAVALAYLALDELLQIHENLDKLVHWWRGLDPENPLTDALDGLIVLFYGVAMLGLLWRNRTPILASRQLCQGLLGTAVAFAAMVFADGKDLWLDYFDARTDAQVRDALTIFEESCKGLGTVLLWWATTDEEPRASSSV